MHDDLGNRMKNFYEDRAKVYLPRRTYTVIRVDGKAFHTYTRRCKKPFDERLMEAMDHSALELCRNVQGCKFAYTQSDEISLLLTDFDNLHTDAWFNGNVQKQVSVAASVATASFNNMRNIQVTAGYVSKETHPTSALFDARVFTIPSSVEVANYFIWRQKDAERNSLQSLARAHFSHKELQNRNRSDLHDMLMSIGINWNDLDAGIKRGRLISKYDYDWEVIEPDVWTQSHQLKNLIPTL